MAQFDIAVNYVLSNEGGLIDNPKDPGGITNFGISLRFLKNLSQEDLRKYSIFDQPSDKTIRDLTKDQAIKIYHDEFWIKASFDKIISQYLCNQVFDMAINAGILNAIKCLQRACWAEHGFYVCKDDGILGYNTLFYINDVTVIPFCSERAGYYRLLVSTHPENQEFLEGWLKRAYGDGNDT